AAGPAMHVALGERWLVTYAPNYSPQEKSLFLLGTVFPDIRYLGVVKRSQTHYKDVTLAQIYQEKSPFLRGMLFHSFVDEYRMKYIDKHKISKKVAQVPSRLQGTFLKVIEDEILHQKHDWTEFRISLASIPDEEKILNINTEALTQWHTALTFYFSTTPSMILTQIGLFDKGILTLDPPTVKTWSTLVPQYAADPGMVQYLNDLMSSFEKALNAKN
ncbi:MAG: hypothetical protein AB7V32_06985, partial [Candidatus Berkiella sp.]